ncbi:MAG: glycosyltransferase family 2 protein, partial [Planctomycetota bacterium]
MTVAIVLAIYGRPRTTLATLRRYQRQTVPMEIVAVGTTDEDKGTAERAGVHFVQHANLPLSDKYQAGINYVRDHLDVEAIMTGGSDSWVSDDWCATGLQYMQKNGWDSVGKSVFYVMSLDTHEILYRGYLPQRAAEPDGNGRMVTRDALDTKLGWHLYPTRRG